MLLELFQDGAGLSCQAGWRLKMGWFFCSTSILHAYLAYCCLPRAGGSSPPYIGNGLGFWVTRNLQDCPYDIIYFLGRLELVAMILYRRCPTGGTIHRERLCGAGPLVRNGRLVRPSSAQPDVCVRVDAGGLIQLAGSRRRCVAGTVQPARGV